MRDKHHLPGKLECNKSIPSKIPLSLWATTKTFIALAWLQSSKWRKSSAYIQNEHEFLYDLQSFWYFSPYSFIWHDDSSYPCRFLLSLLVFGTLINWLYNASRSSRPVNCGAFSEWLQINVSSATRRATPNKISKTWTKRGGQYSIFPKPGWARTRVEYHTLVAQESGDRLDMKLETEFSILAMQSCWWY